MEMENMVFLLEFQYSKRKQGRHKTALFRIQSVKDPGKEDVLGLSGRENKAGKCIKASLYDKNSVLFERVVLGREPELQIQLYVNLV